jgi:predicted flap endonuclease-1-like 5' DNA nuclease
MTKLSVIEGIGDVYAGKLAEAGVNSIEKLLEIGGNKTSRKEIADKMGVSPKLVLNWVNRADLNRIKGISTQYADLLEVAGVDTVPELAQRKPENLHQKMTDVNKTKKLVRQVPALSQVEDWVAQAKKLPRAVNY